MFTDLWGLVAGEKFETLAELTKDWAWNYFPKSQYTLMEQGSCIYRVNDENGNLLYYSYTEAAVGEPHHVDLMKVENMVPKNAEYIGGVHSHPQGGGLSKDDMDGYAKKHDKIIIAVYHQYDNKGNKVIMSASSNAGNAQQPLAVNIPVPRLSQQEKERLSNIDGFEEKWDNHVLYEKHAPTSTCIKGEYRPGSV